MFTAIYPGSFDPITMGHLDVITRASQLFDRILMAIVHNPSKQPLICIEDRIELVKGAVSHLKNVEVESFDGLTVDLARHHKAKAIVRGLRAVSDFEKEFAMAQINKKLAPEIETVFFTADTEYQFLSSSMTKEVARFGGNVCGLVPSNVCDYLAKKGNL